MRTNFDNYFFLFTISCHMFTCIILFYRPIGLNHYVNIRQYTRTSEDIIRKQYIYHLYKKNFRIRQFYFLPYNNHFSANLFEMIYAWGQLISFKPVKHGIFLFFNTGDHIWNGVKIQKEWRVLTRVRVWGEEHFPQPDFNTSWIPIKIGMDHLYIEHLNLFIAFQLQVIHSPFVLLQSIPAIKQLFVVVTIYVALPDYNEYIGTLLSNISKNICTILLEYIMHYLFFFNLPTF